MLLLPLGPESEDLHDAPVARPLVTAGLVGACVLVHLVIWHLAPLGPEQLDVLAYSPARPWSLGLLTYQFVHADLLHLLGNCLFLAAFGVAVERRRGHATVLAVFLLGGVAGAWTYGALAPRIRLVDATGARGVYSQLIGASGSLMGLVGFLLPAMPRLRIRVLLCLGPLFRVVPVPAWAVCLGFLAKEVAMALAVPESQVATTAHLGGMLGGGLLALLPSSPAPLDLGQGLPDLDLTRISTDVGEVPEGRDWSLESGLWTHAAWTADLQERLRRAHAMERQPGQDGAAFAFYRRLLDDPGLASEYRAYAGARMARMLHRAGRNQEACELARRLQRNPLSTALRRHLKQTTLRAFQARPQG